MAKKIAVTNRKGGVGKTTTCINIAYILAHFYDKKVLVIDGDSQRNSTKRLIDPTNEMTLYNVLLENYPINKAIVSTKYKGMYLIPSDVRLDLLTESHFREDDSAFPKMIIRSKLELVETIFDYIIFDTAPSTNFVTLSSIIASDAFLLPTELSEDSCDGLRSIYKVIRSISKVGLTPPIDAGILICRYEKGHVGEIKRLLIQMKEEFPNLLDFKIPATVKISEANNKRFVLSEISTDKKSKHALSEYKKVTDHLIKLLR